MKRLRKWWQWVCEDTRDMWRYDPYAVLVPVVVCVGMIALFLIAAFFPIGQHP